MHACMRASESLRVLEGSMSFLTQWVRMGVADLGPVTVHVKKRQLYERSNVIFSTAFSFFSLCCSGRPVSKQPSRGQWITAVSILFHKITNQRKRARKGLGQHAMSSSAHTATSAHAALLPIPFPSVPPSVSWGLGRGEYEMHGVWNLYLKILTLSLESGRWFLKEITYLGWWWR